MMRESAGSRSGPLMAIAAAALAWGLYARFKGLGLWPLGVDEFYISRSIDFILHTGLPQFPCGGFYQRGLLYQYVVAGLRFTGLTPEFAGRFVTAGASLLVLPAVYLLGRRLHGRTVGLLAVIVMALSVWEVEMARFARMYAPFQAAFAWYLLFFLRYTVDRERRALAPMIALSVVGALLWEGGALMALLGLLPPLLNHREGQLKRKDWAYLIGMMLLFLALYFGTTTDWRLHSSIPSLAEEVALPDSHSASGNESPMLTHLPTHLPWLVAMLVPLGFAFASLPWLWSLRRRWLAAGALGLALFAGLGHQLLLAGGLLILIVLMRLMNWDEFKTRRAAPFLLAMVCSAIFWVAYGLATLPAPKLIELMYQLAGFPAVIQELARPWGRTLPLLSIGLGIALGALIARSARDPAKPPTALGSLLVVLVCMVLAIGASSPPRHETRYAFFLYPLLITLAICAISYVAEWIAHTERRAQVMTIATTLLLFAVTEDFQPRHLARIDSYDINFRIGMPQALAGHYYPRNDVRQVASWLHEHVKAGDEVISGIPNIDPYYPGTNYFFLDENDERYESYACERGTKERWSSLPLLYTTDVLAAQVATNRRLFIILYASRYKTLLAAAQARHWRTQTVRLTAGGGATVLIVNP